MGRKRQQQNQQAAAEMYQRHKQRVREHQAEISRAGREIGIRTDGNGTGAALDGNSKGHTALTLPPCADPDRREKCRLHFLDFCLTYFPQTFTKPVSKNHPKICAVMEEAALKGGKYALCMERGGGKSTFSECFCLWVLCYGHCKFVVFCGATKEAAEDSFNSVKIELESNDLLFADFPEICVPVRALEGKPQRAGGMLLDGKPVGLVWKNDKIVLPVVPGAPSAGAVFKAIGFSGRLRGQKHKTRGGENLRPDCVIVDDIQKDLTARNPKTVSYQLGVLEKSVKGMRKRGAKFTVLVQGTRLSSCCFMSRLTDRKEFPAYQGRIFKAMESLPKNLNLWKEYWKLWLETTEEAQQIDPDSEIAWAAGKEAATKFYKEHRAAMDEGAAVSWPDMYEDDELSGIQNIMNIYLENEDAFWTEYQNEPHSGISATSEITEAGLKSKILDTIPRGVVPAGTTRLTLGCDVQKEMIFWLVTAWQDGFSGHVVDYGSFPEQPTREFDAEKPPRPLSALFPALSLDGRLTKAITDMINGVLLRDWQTESGGVMRIDRGLIDANWEDSKDTVFTMVNRYFRQYKKNGRFGDYPLLPARGRGTSRTGYFYEQKKSMESKTQFSFLQKPKNEEELCATVWINTNKTKTFAAARLCAPVGAPESVTIYGGVPAAWHTLLIQHLTAEFATPAAIGALKYEKWEMKPTRTENHWWDCFIHTVVCNAMEGSRLTEHDAPQVTRRKFRSERILR